MTFLNTMHGMKKQINLVLFNFYSLNVRYCRTKYRKKPKYGSRYLIDKSQVYNFNAWYVPVKSFALIDLVHQIIIKM